LIRYSLLECTLAFVDFLELPDNYNKERRRQSTNSSSQHAILTERLRACGLLMHFLCSYNSWGVYRDFTF